MASFLTRQMTTVRPCRFLLRIVCRGLMRFNLLDVLVVLQLRGCHCTETLQILQLFLTQTEKKTGKRKKNKDVADWHWNTENPKAPCASGNVPHFMPKRSMEATNAAPCFAPTLAMPPSTSRKEQNPQSRTFSHACRIAQRLASISRVLGAHFFSSLPPAEIPPSYFHASQAIHARPALPSRSFQRSSTQAISMLHRPSRSSVSLPPAELPPSYFHASQSIHACPALPSRSLQRDPAKLFPCFTGHHARPALPSRSLQQRSRQAISTLSTPSALVPSFLPCSSGSSASLPSRQRKLNENPSIGDAFGKKNVRTSVAAPAAHTRYLSSPASAFMLRLPPQHEPHATFMQPLHCDSCSHTAFCTNTCHHFPQSPSFVMTLRHHPPSSPFVIDPPSSPFVVTLRHHPSSSLPSATTLRSLLLCDIV